MNKVPYKTRFCPSPTGRLHIGNIRTALFNALLARQHSGTFLLRIEDTDAERSQKIYAEQLQQDLQWLGLMWQEGPGVEGPAGPYWQSQRAAIYDKFYDQLCQQGQAYCCFCSEETLALTRKVQRISGQPPRYPGTCRALSAAEVEDKLSQGAKPTLRFRVPDDVCIEFEDGVHGIQRFYGHDIGDFIIRRADETAAFMYCNAIDDATMGVTLASRGDDHLTNTPRQLMILRALGLPEPQYAHTALILGMDGAPLSKRNGSKSLETLREMGYLPLAILNHLARLGHTYESHELMSLSELAENFSLHALNKAPAKFDIDQLNHWQKQAVQQAADDALLSWAKPAMTQVPESESLAFIRLIKANVVFPSDVQTWAEAIYADTLAFEPEQIQTLQQAGSDYFYSALNALDEPNVSMARVIERLKAATGYKGKALFQPLRLALTAKEHGPEMETLFELMGIERLQQRFQAVLTHF